MKASNGFNSRRTVPVCSFSLSRLQNGQVVLRLLTPNSDGARRRFRGFEIEMTREECERLQKTIARHLGTDPEILKAALHGFGAGLGAALGERILTPNRAALVKDDQGGKGGAA